jgi:hypothetical protein
MRLLKHTTAVLGTLIWGAISVPAYLVAFALQLLSAILAVLTIMMAGVDRAARRNNHTSAFYRARGRGRGIGF